MAKNLDSFRWQRAIVLLTQVVTFVVVIGAMYWAQPILLPIAIAIFFAFILSPMVTQLERTRLGRTPCVIIVVLTVGLLLFSLGWFLSAQVTSLAAELPEHRNKIALKVRSIQQMMQQGVPQRLRNMVEEIKDELNERRPPPVNAAPSDQKGGTGGVPSAQEANQPPLMAVTVIDWQTQIAQYLSTILTSVVSVLLAFVLVIFMLTHREDLRDKIMRLIGKSYITAATKAVDETFQRLSRFLLVQATINACFGIALSLIFTWIGVRYALLWGFLAAVMRYLPYLGIWIAAIFPLTLSVALADGWTQPLLVLASFIVLEIVVSNFVEPYLFGQSVGVSPVALLVSAAFWGFLWGPIGLVLSVPLTVVIVVVGRYVSHLEFLTILMSDEPALPARVSFFQRLLAREETVAVQMAQERAKEVSLLQVEDELLIGALHLLKRDRINKTLSSDDEQQVLQTMHDIVEKLHGTAPGEESETAPASPRSAEKAQLLLCPIRDAIDHLAAEMLSRHIDRTRWEVEVLDTGFLSGELVVWASKHRPDVICLGSVPPGGFVSARYFCKRLRREFPRLKIIIGRWGLRDRIERNTVLLREAGADVVVTSLEETCNRLQTWQSLSPRSAWEGFKPRRTLARKA